MGALISLFHTYGTSLKTHQTALFSKMGTNLQTECSIDRGEQHFQFLFCHSHGNLFCKQSGRSRSVLCKSKRKLCSCMHWYLTINKLAALSLLTPHPMRSSGRTIWTGRKTRMTTTEVSPPRCPIPRCTTNCSEHQRPYSWASQV